MLHSASMSKATKIFRIRFHSLKMLKKAIVEHTYADKETHWISRVYSLLVKNASKIFYTHVFPDASIYMVGKTCLISAFRQVHLMSSGLTIITPDRPLRLLAFRVCLANFHTGNHATYRINQGIRCCRMICCRHYRLFAVNWILCNLYSELSFLLKFEYQGLWSKNLYVKLKG